MRQKHLRWIVFGVLLAVCFMPWTGPALALSLGALIGLFFGTPDEKRVSHASKQLLKASVVMLGFGITIGSVVEVGRGAVVYTLLGILLTYALGALLARVFGADRQTSLLITTGTAICGGSAIAAVAPVIGADQQRTGVALGTVFALNAVGLLIFPPIGRLIGLDEATFGVWAALAIHDTSSVVGACAAYGAVALAVGTTVKLTRALYIVPLALIAGALTKKAGKTPLPLFLLGFLAAAAARSVFPDFEDVWNLLLDLGRRTLVVTIFLIGCGLTRDVLRRVGPRPLLLGVVLWICVSAGTLGAIRTGWIKAPSVKPPSAQPTVAPAVAETARASFSASIRS